MTRLMRPAKIRSAVRRRWFEREVPKLELTPADGLVDVGSAYGGWIIPLERVGPTWTCYCIGVGGDISFDLELAARGATVRAVEPADVYVRGAAEAARDQPLITTHRTAITAVDGPIRMQVTHHDQSQSLSSADLYDGADYVEVPGRTLPGLMEDLGDERVDLLKLDIEGAEYEVLPTLDLRALGVRVFSTQLHHTGSVAQARTLIRGLREQGYVAVACRPVVKLTFLEESELRQD